MPQLFQRRANAIAKACIWGGIVFIGAGGWALYAGYWSSYTTRVQMPRDQVVPFSHKHHVDGLGIDCRYCHTSVEKSAFAGIPPTETCMTCHSQLWTDAPMLAPVRESLAQNRPLHWTRVDDLPDFVFFNHSIHVNKGIGCSTCHGQVDQMPLVWKQNTLYMKWCLDCHKEPEKFLRPREEVFNMKWKSPENQLALGRRLATDHHINKTQLTDCSMCHR